VFDKYYQNPSPFFLFFLIFVPHLEGREAKIIMLITSLDKLGRNWMVKRYTKSPLARDLINSEGTGA